jgi:hypothetical protein
VKRMLTDLIKKQLRLPCTDRAFMNETEPFGVNSEREADSPSYCKRNASRKWKAWKKLSSL